MKHLYLGFALLSILQQAIAADCTITTPSSGCAGSFVVVSVPDQGTNTTYSWSLTGATILDGQGTPQIAFEAPGGASVTIDVTVDDGTSCTGSEVMSFANTGDGAGFLTMTTDKLDPRPLDLCLDHRLSVEVESTLDQTGEDLVIADLIPDGFVFSGDVQVWTNAQLITGLPAPQVSGRYILQDLPGLTMSNGDVVRMEFDVSPNCGLFPAPLPTVNEASFLFYVPGATGGCFSVTEESLQLNTEAASMLITQDPDPMRLAPLETGIWEIRYNNAGNGDAPYIQGSMTLGSSLQFNGIANVVEPGPVTNTVAALDLLTIGTNANNETEITFVYSNVVPGVTEVGSLAAARRLGIQLDVTALDCQYSNMWVDAVVETGCRGDFCTGDQNSFAVLPNYALPIIDVVTDRENPTIGNFPLPGGYANYTMFSACDPVVNTISVTNRGADAPNFRLLVGNYYAQSEIYIDNIQVSNVTGMAVSNIHVTTQMYYSSGWQMNRYGDGEDLGFRTELIISNFPAGASFVLTYDQYIHCAYFEENRESVTTPYLAGAWEPQVYRLHRAWWYWDDFCGVSRSSYQNVAHDDTNNRWAWAIGAWPHVRNAIIDGDTFFSAAQPGQVHPEFSIPYWGAGHHCDDSSLFLEVHLPTYLEWDQGSALGTTIPAHLFTGGDFSTNSVTNLVYNDDFTYDASNRVLRVDLTQVYEFQYPGESAIASPRLLLDMPLKVRPGCYSGVQTIESVYLAEDCCADNHGFCDHVIDRVNFDTFVLTTDNTCTNCSGIVATGIKAERYVNGVLTNADSHLPGDVLYMTDTYRVTGTQSFDAVQLVKDFWGQVGSNIETPALDFLGPATVVVHRANGGPVETNVLASGDVVCDQANQYGPGQNEGDGAGQCRFDVYKVTGTLNPGDRIELRYPVRIHCYQEGEVSPFNPGNQFYIDSIFSVTFGRDLIAPDSTCSPYAGGANVVRYHLTYNNNYMTTSTANPGRWEPCVTRAFIFRTIWQDDERSDPFPDENRWYATNRVYSVDLMPGLRYREDWPHSGRPDGAYLWGQRQWGVQAVSTWFGVHPTITYNASGGQTLTWDFNNLTLSDGTPFHPPFEQDWDIRIYYAVQVQCDFDPVNAYDFAGDGTLYQMMGRYEFEDNCGDIRTWQQPRNYPYIYGDLEITAAPVVHPTATTELDPIEIQILNVGTGRAPKAWMKIEFEEDVVLDRIYTMTDYGDPNPVDVTSSIFITNMGQSVFVNLGTIQEASENDIRYFRFTSRLEDTNGDGDACGTGDPSRERFATVSTGWGCETATYDHHEEAACEIENAEVDVLLLPSRLQLFKEILGGPEYRLCTNYTVVINVRNTGATELKEFTVLDELLPGMTYINGSTTFWKYDEDGIRTQITSCATTEPQIVVMGTGSTMRTELYWEICTNETAFPNEAFEIEYEMTTDCDTQGGLEQKVIPEAKAPCGSIVTLDRPYYGDPFTLEIGPAAPQVGLVALINAYNADGCEPGTGRLTFTNTPATGAAGDPAEAPLLIEALPLGVHYVAGSGGGFQTSFNPAGPNLPEPTVYCYNQADQYVTHNGENIFLPSTLSDGIEILVWDLADIDAMGGGYVEFDYVADRNCDFSAQINYAMLRYIQPLPCLGSSIICSNIITYEQISSILPERRPIISKTLSSDLGVCLGDETTIEIDAINTGDGFAPNFEAWYEYDTNHFTLVNATDGGIEVSPGLIRWNTTLNRTDEDGDGLVTELAAGAAFTTNGPLQVTLRFTGDEACGTQVLSSNAAYMTWGCEPVTSVSNCVSHPDTVTGYCDRDDRVASLIELWCPSIGVKKYTRSHDGLVDLDVQANQHHPGGLYLLGGDEVTWTYVITNTGNVVLDLSNVIDSVEGPVVCEEGPLPAQILIGEQIVCTMTGIVQCGDYSNLVSVSARSRDFANTEQFCEVGDGDPANYFGVCPGIDIEKATNGEDADLPTGPFIAVGSNVVWTYVVANTGNVALAGVHNSVIDDSEGAAFYVDGDADGDGLLDTNEVWTFVHYGLAAEGQYANDSQVTGFPVYEDGSELPGFDPVTDEDPSHYFGVLPGILVQKSTNGEDADTPIGPAVEAGSAVTWTYTVSNPGNVALTNVAETITDSVQDTPTYVSGDTDGDGLLDVDETWIFEITAAPSPSGFTTASGGTAQSINLNTSTFLGSDNNLYTGYPTGDAGPVTWIGADGVTATLTYTAVGTLNPNGSNLDNTAGLTAGFVLSNDTDGGAKNAPGTRPLNYGRFDVAFSEPFAVTVVVQDIDEDGDNTINYWTDTLALEGWTGSPGLVGSGIDFQYDWDQWAHSSDNVLRDYIWYDDTTFTELPFVHAALPGQEPQKSQVGNLVNHPRAQITATIGEKVQGFSIYYWNGDLGSTNTGSQAIHLFGDFATISEAPSGQYSNLVTVCGQAVGPDGTVLTNFALVKDDDPSHLFAYEAGIDIEKLTEGEDADLPTGPYILTGEAVTWTYEVRNTGVVPLRGVLSSVIDSHEGAATYLSGDADGDLLLDTNEVWTFEITGAASAGQYSNNSTVVGTPVMENGDPIPGATDVTDSDPSHYFGYAPGIDIEKATNGEDADAPTGPIVSTGSNVVWTYVVRNTGNTMLYLPNDIDDSVEGTPTFVGGDANGNGFLDTNEVWVYTASGTATAGQYSNLSSVVATPLTATTNKIDHEVSDEDPSHYFGANPGIDIEKATNGQDSDAPYGQIYDVGDAITWTYVVRNTGDVPLRGVAASINDNQEGVPTYLDGDTDGDTLLDVNEIWRFEITGHTAQAGAYSNHADVVGTPVFDDGTPIPGLPDVSDLDPSHYYGRSAGIDVEKFTNGEDADTGPGPIVEAGSEVVWTYLVTNTGTDPLTNVAENIRDNLEGTPAYVSGDTDGDGLLDVDETWLFTIRGEAQGGQYSNMVEVCAAPVDADGKIIGDKVCDMDPSHYFGVKAGIQLEKFTNGEDADTPTGPILAEGDEVKWTYVVVNDGNVPLANVIGRVIDNLEGAAFYIGGDDDNDGRLDIDEKWEFQILGTAEVGQYANTAQVTGTPVMEDGSPTGLADVMDDDPSHYFGTRPGIDLEKHTNGEDADDPTGPYIQDGDPVTWTYIVRNTGTDPLAGVDASILDDVEGQPGNLTGDDDGDGLLDVDEVWTFTLHGVAGLGQYENNASVTGTPVFDDGSPIPGAQPVSDADPSHYFGVRAGIDIEKATNGEDADTGTGPFIPEGDVVTWTYVVRNTGNVPLQGVLTSVLDDHEGAAFYVSGELNGNLYLDTNEVYVFQIAGIAEMGQYENLAGVVGTPVDDDGNPIPGLGDVGDSDPSHYYGLAARLDIEKYTNGEDADAATGPIVPTGSNVVWTYVVRNTGNVPMAGVITSVIDSVEGAASFVGGDVNSNEILDLDETFLFTISGTAAAGQYSNLACVTGIPVSPCTEVECFGRLDSYPDNPFLFARPLVGGGVIHFQRGVSGTLGNIPTDTCPLSLDIQGIMASNIVSGSGESVFPARISYDFRDGVGGSVGLTFEFHGDSPNIDIVAYYSDGLIAREEVIGVVPSDQILNGTLTLADPDGSANLSLDLGTNGSFSVQTGVALQGPVELFVLPWYEGREEARDELGNYYVAHQFSLTSQPFTVNGTPTELCAGPTILPEFEPVVAKDPSHYYGVNPGIDIEKYTNGDDADAPSGPVILAGDPVVWTYVVRNTGDTALRGVYASVIDSHEGAAAYVDGDLDGDLLLDTNEVWTFEITGTAETGQYSNHADVVGTPVFNDGTTIPGLTDVTDSDPSHYFGSMPGIDIEKATNGEDADTPTGPHITVGDPVVWTYVVRNTGSDPLAGVMTGVVDDVEGAATYIDGDADNDDLLDVDEVWTFEIVATATNLGQYANSAMAVGTPVDENNDPLGPPVADDDPSHYFGVDAAIDLEKATNGEDADTPTGPILIEGSAVTWTYTVANPGNVALAGVAGRLIDDLEGAAYLVGGDTDADGLLDTNEFWTFEIIGTAGLGQYSNTAQVAGTPVDENGNTIGLPDVTDLDPSHYFGTEPGIHIEKYTNGDDADTPTGPIVATGGAVTWTYLVTNTGNLPLAGVTNSVIDSVEGAAFFTGGDTDGDGLLDPDETFRFTLTGTAEAGQYSNLATVVGIPVNTNGTPIADADPVTDDDPSHYFGAQPGIDIEKLTNGDDADAPSGPVLTAGDTVTWTYIVRNTGDTALRGVRVSVIDNLEGAATYQSGDLDVDLLLDTNEVWTFVITGTAGIGQYSNHASVVGTPVFDDGTAIPGLEDVTDLDPSHYFGTSPGIDIEKATNGEDADTPTGPYIAVGDPVTWTYVVRNTGSDPLAGVMTSVIDNVEGPATYVSGDLDNDDRLDVGEVWTFEIVGTATTTGQYANSATVMGTPVDANGDSAVATAIDVDSSSTVTSYERATSTGPPTGTRPRPVRPSSTKPVTTCSVVPGSDTTTATARRSIPGSTWPPKPKTITAMTARSATAAKPTFNRFRVF